MLPPNKQEPPPPIRAPFSSQPPFPPERFLLLSTEHDESERMTTVVVLPPSPRGQARLKAGGHTSSSDMGCHQTPFHVMMFADKERAWQKVHNLPPPFSTTLFSKGYWVTFLQLCPHTHTPILYTHTARSGVLHTRKDTRQLARACPSATRVARLPYTPQPSEMSWPRRRGWRSAATS